MNNINNTKLASSYLRKEKGGKEGRKGKEKGEGGWKEKGEGGWKEKGEGERGRRVEGERGRETGERRGGRQEEGELRLRLQTKVGFTNILNQRE